MSNTTEEAQRLKAQIKKVVWDLERVAGFSAPCWAEDVDRLAALASKQAPAVSGQPLSERPNTGVEISKDCSVQITDCRIDNDPAFMEYVGVRIGRAMSESGQPLSEAEIEELAKEATWLGYRKDADGRYTIPIISTSVLRLIRSVEAKHGIASTPGRD